MKISNKILERLANLRYPATKVDAAIDWNISVEKAARHLFSAKATGWLYKEGKQFIPTPELLQAWIKNGFLA
jgi:hypothetical protein